jgi:hypothetical protein
MGQYTKAGSGQKKELIYSAYQEYLKLNPSMKVSAQDFEKKFGEMSAAYNRIQRGEGSEDDRKVLI